MIFSSVYVPAIVVYSVLFCVNIAASQVIAVRSSDFQKAKRQQIFVMEDVSAAAAAAAPTAVDDNSAAAGSPAAATPAASLTPPGVHDRQLRSVSDRTEGPAHRAGTVRSLSSLQKVAFVSAESHARLP